MNEEKLSLIEYLRGKAGDKSVMTPAQLAKEIGISAKQQSELRQDEKFPIPHTNVGRRVFYSVNAIADFLLSGKTKKASEPEAVDKVHDKVEQRPNVTPKATNKIRNAPVDLSHKILLGFMVGRLKEQREQIDAMIGSFEQLIKSKSLHDELQQSMAKKETKLEKFAKPFKA